MEFSEQIKDPRWQKKRLQVLELHDFKCEICGNTENELHVHHSRYIKNRMYWEYDNDVLMCLCSKCHERIHKKTQVVKEVKKDREKELGKILYKNFEEPEFIVENLLRLKEIDGFENIFTYYIDAGYIFTSFSAFIESQSKRIDMLQKISNIERILRENNIKSTEEEPF